MLTINRVTYGDAGQYTCSAKNSEGKNEAAFHITVTGKRWLNFISFSCSSFFLRFFFFFLFCHTFTFFELYFWILCSGPPEINPELKNQSVAYNSSLQFICSLSGFPTPEILWTKDGVNLGNNNTLTIRQARFEDSGQYTCSANNSEGSKNSTFWIEVAGGTVLIYILKELESIIIGWMRIKSFLWYHMQFKDLKPQKFQNWLKILKKDLIDNNI